MLSEIETKLFERLYDLREGLNKHDQHETAEGIVKALLSVPAELTVRETADKTLFLVKKFGFTSGPWEYLVSKLKEDYHAPYVPSDEPNYLVDGSDFEKTLATLLALKGKPVFNKDNIYGWVDNDMWKHIIHGKNNGTCSIVEVTSVEEDEWSEFGDTFVGSNDYHGFIGDAKCSCGWFVGQLRVEGELGELFGMMFRKAPLKK